MIIEQPGKLSVPDAEAWIVAHVVNDAGVWGTGFAMDVYRYWPQARTLYFYWSKTPGFALGFTQFVAVGLNQYVANMVAQHGLRNRVPVDYEKLRVCLWQVAEFAKTYRLSVHMPHVGADWHRVLGIIRSTMHGADVYIYDGGSHGL